MMAPKGRHPKRDLNPRFISPYPCNNPIIKDSVPHTIYKNIQQNQNKNVHLNF